MIVVPDVHHAHGLDFVHLVEIVRGEYLEMPGLRLTKKQAQRLWAIDADTCDALLNKLERASFLRRTRDGEYILASPNG